jgi:heat shock protein HslJ
VKKNKLLILFFVLDIAIGIAFLFFYKPTGFGKNLFCSLNPDNIECIADQNSKLLDNNWKLIEFNDEKIESYDITLTIRSGEIGIKICNSIGYGKVEITDTHINFHPNAAYTKMYCDGEIGRLEGEIKQILNKPMLYQLNPERQELIIVEKENKLVFKANNSVLD